ncbi:MAG: hypothetical protein ACFCVK_01980 [Acidimicrobiales bacterium]
MASRPLGPDDARNLVLELEHSGINADRITVSTHHPNTQAEVGRVDRGSVARPAIRVAIMSILGALTGLAAAAVLLAATDLRPGPTLIVAVILGSVSGLVALYWRLPSTPEVQDVDTGGPSIVIVDLVGLDDHEARKVTTRLDEA